LTRPDDIAADARPRRAVAERCATCGRDTALTFHHLIPRKLHRRKHFRRHYDRDVLTLGIHVCRACHRGIHKRFDEMTLGRHFNTLARLREDPDLARHFAWVGKQKS
jgi:5-methylcytosine-specific restriction endonuclease McrA